jgi:hypothetical protein
MSKRTRAGAFGGLAVAAALAAGLGIYPVFFRRQCLTWGARPDEVSRKLPGDELLPGAGIVATRAITIDAPPPAIWPWLVQMGSGRGGVYTYDWIENLFGLDMHSTRRILPQYQERQGRRRVPAGPRQGRHAGLRPRPGADVHAQVRRRELGVDLRAVRRGRADQADQPEPDRGGRGVAGPPVRHAGHGARQSDTKTGFPAGARQRTLA